MRCVAVPNSTTGKRMGEPAIDAPRVVDQLAWWVQHGEELRMEVERLREQERTLREFVVDTFGLEQSALLVAEYRRAHIDGKECDA
jgi:hypothetical protein